MAVNNITLLDGVSPQVLTPINSYTSISGTRIIAFTVTNSTINPYRYKVFIGLTATLPYEIIPWTTIRQEAHVPVEILNQLIPQNAKLFIQVDTINVLQFRASGIEF